MAAFLLLWEKRGCVLDEIVSFSQEAEKYREAEYKATLKLQSWYRACKLRAYVRHLHRCALIIQRTYRGYEGRKRYRHRLKECLEERRKQHYNGMATRIQSCWRGFYVRKFVFDYYDYHQHMAQILLTNAAVSTEATSFWEKTEETRLSQEERSLEAQALVEARRLHFMLSTESKDGIFRPFGKPLPIEVQMTSLRFNQERKLPTETTRRTSLPPSSHRPTQKSGSFGSSPTGRHPDRTGHPDMARTPHSPSKQGSTRSGSVGLPPLTTPRPQGPFLSTEKVWKYRTRSLNPTLRVETPFNSVEEARAELKAREWRERVVEERFKPFSKKQFKYEPMLHTKAPFEKLAYGTIRFRDEEPSANISPQPFRTLVPTSPFFDSDTY